MSLRLCRSLPLLVGTAWPTAAAGAWAVLSGAAKDTDWANPSQVK